MEKKISFLFSVLFSISKKTHDFSVCLIRKRQVQGGIRLKNRSLLFVNDCFEVKPNAAIAVFLQALFITTNLHALNEDHHTLRYHADRQEVFVGAAVNNVFFNISSEHIYTRTLRQEFNMLVAENAMKFGPLRPQPGVFNFTRADQLISFAQENQMTPRGHALIWHNQLPHWVEEGEFTRDSLLAVMEEHITTVVDRYKGIVREWDVVNEAIHMGEADNFRRTLFYDIIGPEYIDSAFVYAHRADPEALLFYNDYSAEAINPKSDMIYNMVQGMIERGIPIHGVGLQGHFILNQINFSSIDQNIKRLGDIGLHLYLSDGSEERRLLHVSTR